ncbi:uncharacterized protein LOC142589728 isoform X2 [Dermacentor variabilis]|uniref:uncharacterized protein LOC142589728 isoform X2 n=1 Tax=Dermacentor variabilis TaxID=34621 RepID=UPI003F5C10A5
MERSICMFDELPRITDPAAALFNLEGLYQAVLAELELPVNVSSVATLLCYRFNFSLEACAQPAVSGDARCGSFLSVFFPSSFAVRQCVDRSALICFEGDQPKEGTIKALFDMLTCVFEGAPENLRPRLARSLACPLVQLLRLALKQFAEVITWPLVAEQVRDSVEQLATLLLHLANCRNDMATITSGSASSITTTLPSSTTRTNSATATVMSSADSPYNTPTSNSTSTNTRLFTTNSSEATTVSSNTTNMTGDRTGTTISSASESNTTSPNQTPLSTALSSTRTQESSSMVPTYSETTNLKTASATATSRQGGLPTTNIGTPATSARTMNFSANSQRTSTGPPDGDAVTTSATLTTRGSSSVNPDQDTVSTSPNVSNSGTTTLTVPTTTISPASGSGENTLSSTTYVTTNTSAVVSSYPATSTTSSTTGFSIRTITSSEPTTGSSSPTLSPPSTTASSMTLPPSSQTSSPFSTPTSSVPSSSSQASGHTSTQGPSSAPAENNETGNPASVPTSTTAPTQTGNNASITLSTIISTSTSPIPSSASGEMTSMQPTEVGSPFTVTRSPRTEVNSDSSNTTPTERLSTTQRTILTSLTIAGVNATPDATMQTGTSVTQASTSRISASITTVSRYNLTTTTGETTEPQNSNTPIRVTTIFTTSNIPTGSTVSVPSDGSSINGTSMTEGQTISRATTASNSSPGASSDGTSLWPSLPSSSNTFYPKTSSTVSDQSSANNSTPVTTSTARSTNMTSFMTVSSVTSTASVSPSASTMQGSKEMSERTSVVSTAVTSASPTTGSSASCVNITLPNLFGLDTCLGRTLDACTTDNVSCGCLRDRWKRGHVHNPGTQHIPEPAVRTCCSQGHHRCGVQEIQFRRRRQPRECTESFHLQKYGSRRAVLQWQLELDISKKVRKVHERKHSSLQRKGAYSGISGIFSDEPSQVHSAHDCRRRPFERPLGNPLRSLVRSGREGPPTALLRIPA